MSDESSEPKAKAEKGPPVAEAHAPEVAEKKELEAAAAKQPLKTWDEALAYSKGQALPEPARGAIPPPAVAESQSRDRGVDERTQTARTSSDLTQRATSASAPAQAPNVGGKAKEREGLGTAKSQIYVPSDQQPNTQTTAKQPASKAPYERVVGGEFGHFDPYAPDLSPVSIPDTMPSPPRQDSIIRAELPLSSTAPILPSSSPEISNRIQDIVRTKYGEQSHETALSSELSTIANEMVKNGKMTSLADPTVTLEGKDKFRINVPDDFTGTILMPKMKDGQLVMAGNPPQPAWDAIDCVGGKKTIRLMDPKGVTSITEDLLEAHRQSQSISQSMPSPVIQHGVSSTLMRAASLERGESMPLPPIPTQAAEPPLRASTEAAVAPAPPPRATPPEAAVSQPATTASTLLSHQKEEAHRVATGLQSTLEKHQGATIAGGTTGMSLEKQQAIADGKKAVVAA